MNKNLEAVFGESTLKVIEIDGVRWMKCSDVARALDYQNAKSSVTDFLKSNRELLSQGVRKIRTPSRGGDQESWFFNLSGLIAFLIKTNQPKAVEFQKMAVKVLGEHIKKEVDKTSLQYKTIREKSKKIRVGFTDVLKEHGLTTPTEYKEVTYATKTSLGIYKYRPKSELDLWELCQVSMAETLSTYEIGIQSPIGLDEIIPVVQDSSDRIKKI